MFSIPAKKTLALIAALGMVVSLQAQTKANANPKHCLWKITTPKNTVYFLGSIHLLKKENYPLPKAFDHALQEAEVVVLELHPDSLAPARLQKLTMAKATYPSGKTLQSSIAPATYKMADERLRELGMAAALFNGFEPWLVALTITVAKLQQLGLDPNLGVDKHYFDKAKAANKEIASFETAEYQLDRIDGLSPKNQEAFLLQTLTDWDSISRDFDELVQAWVSGDPQALADKLFASYKEYPEIYAKLLTERNRNWLPRIEEYLQEERDYLIVVGAGHLIGKDSVLQLLQAKGYQPEQL